MPRGRGGRDRRDRGRGRGRGLLGMHQQGLLVDIPGHPYVSHTQPFPPHQTSLPVCQVIQPNFYPNYTNHWQVVEERNLYYLQHAVQAGMY